MCRVHVKRLGKLVIASVVALVVNAGGAPAVASDDPADGASAGERAPATATASAAAERQRRAEAAWLTEQVRAARRR
jgi:hypothetical protein